MPWLNSGTVYSWINGIKDEIEQENSRLVKDDIFFKLWPHYANGQSVRVYVLNVIWRFN